MVIVAGHITVEPQQRESYLAGCVSVVERARRAAGCLDFTITADLVVPSVPDSSLGCAITDPVIALWCFVGAPSVYDLFRRSRQGGHANEEALTQPDARL